MLSTAAMVPKVVIPEAKNRISKVEMSAATITALRAMMREEITNGMLEMEDRSSTKLQQAVGNMKEEVKLLSEGLWTKQSRNGKHWWRRWCEAFKGIKRWRLWTSTPLLPWQRSMHLCKVWNSSGDRKGIQQCKLTRCGCQKIGPGWRGCDAKPSANWKKYHRTWWPSARQHHREL